MRHLSTAVQNMLHELARRHGFSPEAVAVMLDAVIRGQGSMAQFGHAEFGGSGQWMQGGMTMIGDMFNSGLKYRVEALCRDLSRLIAEQPDIVRTEASQTGQWWPERLGWPNSTGGQNNIRYAYFGQAHRLAIDIGGTVTVYDTQDHQISGVSQQHSREGSLMFTSQYGLVDLASLPIV